MHSFTIGLFLFSSLLTAAVDPTVGCNPKATFAVFPQMAVGGGWKTEIHVVNPTPTAHAYIRLQYFDDLSRPLTVMDNSFAGGLQTLSDLAVEPHQHRVVSLTGGATTQQGYVLAHYCNANLRLIYSSFTNGHLSEAIVPALVTAMNGYGIPYDNTGGKSTGIALVNSDLLKPLDYRAVVYHENGTQAENNLYSLAQGQHTSFDLVSHFPETSGRMGTIAFYVVTSSVSSSQLSFTGLRFTPGGAFTGIDPVSIIP